jgi:hypothetical protein
VPGLLNVQNCPLRAPFKRELDVPGDCFCSEAGRLPTLHDGLDDVRLQEGQANQAAHIANGEPLACSDLCKRSGLAGAEFIEPAMCQPDSGTTMSEEELQDYSRSTLLACESATRWSPS